MFVSAINVYPVKGMAGGQADEALVEPWGLLDDRRWMIVDASGRFLTQRTLPRMATIRATITPGGVSLSLPRAGRIDVPTPGAGAAYLPVLVWRDTLAASLAGDAAHAWVSVAIGQPCRLVHMHDTSARPINPAHGRPGETTSLADAYPVLLTSLASLADLNARLAHPIPIDRFRGNIVVDGAPPWAEDTWRRIRIGGATFRVAKPCDRCIVTTIDQATGERPDRAEPLRTLGTFRHDARGLMFGQNLIPETLGRIAVGDAVEVLASGPPNVVPVPG
jgi:uncharacterized protein YcbX